MEVEGDGEYPSNPPSGEGESEVEGDGVSNSCVGEGVSICVANGDGEDVFKGDGDIIVGIEGDGTWEIPYLFSASTRGPETSL